MHSEPNFDTVMVVRAHQALDRSRGVDPYESEASMGQSVLFVSVNRSMNESMSLTELEPWVASAWSTTVARAARCDRVVAMFEGSPVAAWRIRGAYPTEETYQLSNGDRRFRIGLALGDALPVLEKYMDAAPPMRRGVMLVADVDVEPLPGERADLAEDVGAK